MKFLIAAILFISFQAQATMVNSDDPRLVCVAIGHPSKPSVSCVSKAHIEASEAQRDLARLQLKQLHKASQKNDQELEEYRQFLLKKLAESEANAKKNKK